MKKIAINIGDGTIEIMSAPANWKEEYQRWVSDRIREKPRANREGLLYEKIEPKDMTHDKYIEFIQGKDIPAVHSSRIVEDTIFPEDKTFREAWTDDGEQIDTDMPRARVIHLENIRKAREEKFLEMGFPVQLDADLEAAVIPVETRATLETLRDIPQTFDLSGAGTPEELKALWPEEL